MIVPVYYRVYYNTAHVSCISCSTHFISFDFGRKQSRNSHIFVDLLHYYFEAQHRKGKWLYCVFVCMRTMVSDCKNFKKPYKHNGRGGHLSMLPNLLFLTICAESVLFAPCVHAALAYWTKAKLSVKAENSAWCLITHVDLYFAQNGDLVGHG